MYKALVVFCYFVFPSICFVLSLVCLGMAVIYASFSDFKMVAVFFGLFVLLLVVGFLIMTGLAKLTYHRN